jgi:ABC-2 type transport system permease protein
MPEFSILQSLRFALFRNSARLVARESFWRASTIVMACIIIWGSLFIVSYLGFRLMQVRFGLPLNLTLPELIFDFLFLVLMVMLFFSTALILYGALFASPECQFLLLSPVPDDQVFAYKFQGAIAFGSWGFLLLGSPVLIAYGIRIEGGAPWYFYVMMPLFFFGFVLIPGSAGAMACLVIVNFAPRHWRQLFIGLLVVLVLALWWRIRPHSNAPRIDREWFDKFLTDLGAMRGIFYPFHWVAVGLKSAATRDWVEAVRLLALVWSNGLLLYLLAVWLGRKLLRRGVNRVVTGGSLTRSQVRSQWLDLMTDRALFFLEPQTRLLIIKDLRTFRRDPSQWMQILIFVGLGGAYFFNMRHYYRNDIGPDFKNFISLLTLTATSFLMCAYTGRFIFPMLSLEGRKFWILGLLPLDRRRLIWGKFAFAAATCLTPYSALVCFSDWMLDMPWQIILNHFLTMCVIAMGLSGISVGLGTIMPNFRETDPSKIAIGFGGTMNLLLGLGFLLVVVALMSVPFHFYFSPSTSGAGDVRVHYGLFALGIAFGAACTIVPIRLGMRTLARMEF